MRRFVAGLSSSFVIAAAACNDAGPPPVAPATMAAAPVTTIVVDAGPMTASSGAAAPPEPPVTPARGASAGGDGGADFYSCSADADCTAVPRVGCCQNGFLEAVNKQSAEAYRASFVCDKRRPICPMYRILDKRQPVCGSASHRCELVKPSP